MTLTNNMTGMPIWFQKLLSSLPAETHDRLSVVNGVVRQDCLLSTNQDQTKNTFGFKWHQRDSFETNEMTTFTTDWMLKKYGPIETHLNKVGKKNPLVLDAGCGAGWSGFHYFGPVMEKIRFVVSDISAAIDIAAERAASLGHKVGLLQADLMSLPFDDGTFDMIFSEGVLHHTESTECAIKTLAGKLSPGGIFMFYVYKKKGPVREFTDDYVRNQLGQMSPDEAWKATEALTRLGISLGELDLEIDVKEPIDILGIPAGKMSVQRLFYWNVAKLFYRPEMSFSEMNHINFDWYAPANAHRQTPEDTFRWCEEAGMTLLSENVEHAGITIIAQKQ